MAHKKAGGSSRNGRDSAGQRLGVKRFAGQTNWHIEWKMCLEPRGGGCRLSGVTSAVHVTYTLPRWATRDLAFKNPLVANSPVAFLQRHRFISQMLHEYLGYYYDYAR